MIRLIPLKARIYVAPEIIHFDVTAGGIICVHDPNSKVGGGAIITEGAFPKAKELISDLLQQVREATGMNPVSLEFKIAGTGVLVDFLKRVVADLGFGVKGSHIEKPEGQVVGFFYTDSGRLRVQAEPERRVRDLGPPQGGPDRRQKKKVLIVDDSQVIRQILEHIFKMDRGLEVVGTADSPKEVESLISRLRPDVITLDINMPEVNGVTLLQRLMPKFPIPVVMISSISMEEGNQVFRALELGAVDYIQKPTYEELDSHGPQIAERVRLAASVKVRRRSRVVKAVRHVPEAGLDQKALVAIGSSTGGTEALKHIFLQLPPNIPPILVVQHIPPVFSAAFAKRLNDLCPFEVKEAQSGDAVRPGRVLIAPGGKQMKLVGQKGDFKVKISDDPPVNRHKPSVDFLFDSIADSDAAKTAIGVILTGMGGDGAQGLLKMKQQGAQTVAQDEASCVVFGMPREAIRLGAAEKVASLDDIPETLLKMLKK